jgi:NADP-dependent 3-hydroxy acid dehydrogenase YdfG
MDKTLIGSFIIDQSMSDVFGQASGDTNPLHLDPIVARRYQFGSTVIHGVSGTLMALEKLALVKKESWAIDNISVQYNKPIRQGDQVEVFSKLAKNGSLRLEVFCQGKRCQLIKLNFSENHIKSQPLKDIRPNTQPCQNLPFEKAIDIDTEVELVWQSELMQTLFPTLTASIPQQQLSLIMGLTNIVGMHCPGVNSVFGGFELSFAPTTVNFIPKLAYKVKESDSRFSRIIISVDHAWAQGNIEALFRAEPIQQPSFDKVSALVKDHEFQDQKALIVGGSRGIGEIAAKVISAGGGEVIIGYAKGKFEAQKIMDEIVASGGKATIQQLDVLNINEDSFSAFAVEELTNIYYFASPLIEKSDAKTFDTSLFNRFCQFYLNGFTQVIDKLLSNSIYRKNGLQVFVPSTSFLVEQPEGFGEYIAAKAAVETFAQQFNKKHKTWHIATPRLPRVPTDQTAAVAKEDPILTAHLLLTILRDNNRERDDSN